MMYLMAVWFRR